MKILETLHRLCDFLDEPMILLDDVVQILHLQDLDQRPKAEEPQEGVDVQQAGRIGVGSRVAVGTRISPRPPRSSQRALLTHWALPLGVGVKPCVGQRVSYRNVREEPSASPIELRPRHPGTLAATPKHPHPDPDDGPEKPTQARSVTGNCIVVQVSVKDPAQPCPCFSDRSVQSPAQLHLNFPKLGSHPLADGLAPNEEPSLVARSGTVVREAEEPEGIWPSFPSFLTLLLCIPTESDQLRLFRVQFQIELAQPYLQILQEGSCLMLILKAEDRVIRIADDNDVA